MSTLFSFSLVIVLIVFFHELGHFLVARACGIKVKAFAVGMGPKILSRVDKHETEWKLCILPIGGYVQMIEGDEAKNTSDLFDNKPVWKRLSVVLAGPLASLLLGWILFFGVFAIYGTKESPNYLADGIGEVLKDTPAQSAGLQYGDVITQITVDGKVKATNNFYDVYVTVQNVGKKPMVLTVKRGDKIKYMPLISRAVLDERTNKIVYRIGFKAQPLKTKKISIGESLSKANQVTVHSLTMIYDAVIRMFKEGIGEDMGGPIKIAQISGEAGRAGMEYLWGFIAMLSINLAVINMLPLPIMDGGRALLLMIEGVFRRPLHKKITETIMLISVSFMLCFFVFITLKDLGFF